MEETYTFSRALHLMRYSGAKMRCLQWNDLEEAICVFDDKIMDEDMQYEIEWLDTASIMGSWVEVK